MRLILSIALTLLCIKTSCAQTSESLADLQDSIMRKEIASFSLKGATLFKNDTSTRPKLTEIPISSCKGGTINFRKGSDGVEILSRIDSATHRSMVDMVVCILHSHYLVDIPKASYAGLYDPNISCDSIFGKKRVIFYSSTCKVFASEDESRMYVYMQNGSGANRYEVTWVINREKYYTRVVDKL